MELHEIVSKLVGEIRGIGESSSDKKRLENIKAFIQLHDEMTCQLLTIARDKDSYESSVKNIGLEADKALIYIQEYLQEYLKPPTK